jgi:YD repeat-containing protein
MNKAYIGILSIKLFLNQKKINIPVKIRYYILSFFILPFLIFPNILHGQDEALLPNSPVTPEVATFTRFLEFPISHYSGSVDITVPIYSLEIDNVNISMTLKYNSAGVKVEEESSWVGLGWSLFAGGLISRQIKGRPDDSEHGWDFASYYMPPYPNDYCQNRTEYYHQKYYFLINGEDFICHDPENPDYPESNTFYFQNVSNEYDFEPDIYSYSFNGYSGTFSFDIEGNLVTHEYTPLKITKILDNNFIPAEVYWEITDLSGIKYEFAKRQKTTTYKGGYGLMDYYTSAWFLTKITTAKGKIINFEYSGSPQTVTIPIYSETYDCIAMSDVIRSLSYATYTPLHLAQINTSEGNSIVFYKSRRRDLENGSRLDSIHLYNLHNDLVKNFHFEYDYFIAASNAYELPITDIGEYLSLLRLKSGYNVEQAEDSALIRNHYRLKLEGFTEVDQTNSKEIKYSFQYNPVQLPSKTSFSLDYWGYYNGAPNQYKIPHYINYVDYCSTSRCFENIFLVRLKADRSVNEAKGKACLLEKITYPTGGNLQIEYEPHYITNLGELEPYDANGNPIVDGQGGGYRVKSLTNSDPVSDKTLKRFYDYYDGILLNIPLFAQQNKDYQTYSDQSRKPYDRLWVSSYSNALSSNIMSNSQVGYSKVVERMVDGTSLSLLTEYTYYNDPEETFNGLCSSGSCWMPAVPNYKNGLLKTRIERNVKGTVVREVLKNYSFTEQTKNYGLTISYYQLPVGLYEILYTLNPKMEQYYFSFYKIMGQRSLLSSVEETVDGISSLTTYTYNSNNLYQTVTTSNSIGQSTTTHSLYPDDYNITTGFIGDLKNAGILKSPIEQYEIQDGLVIGGKLITYKTGIDKGLPDKVYKLQPEMPLILNNQFYVSNYQGGYSDQYYTTGQSPEISFDKYESGKPIQYSTSSGSNISYIWGYSYMYPIAKAVNASYNKILYEGFEDYSSTGYLNTTAKTGRYSWGYPYPVVLPSAGTYLLTYWKKESGQPWEYVEQTISANTQIGNTSSTLIDEVRLYPPDAMMTTYTYDPLVGITSITDERNQTSYYVYDALGRLQYIKDFEGNVLQRYEYNYAE